MVEYFFKHYKSREYNKFVKILGFVDSKTANDLYKEAIDAYKKKVAEPFGPLNLIYR
jgi:inorganic pyrophosphatase